MPFTFSSFLLRLHKHCDLCWIYSLFLGQLLFYMLLFVSLLRVCVSLSSLFVLVEFQSPSLFVLPWFQCHFSPMLLLTFNIWVQYQALQYSSKVLMPGSLASHYSTRWLCSHTNIWFYRFHLSILRAIYEVSLQFPRLNFQVISAACLSNSRLSVCSWHHPLHLAALFRFILY